MSVRNHEFTVSTRGSVTRWFGIAIAFLLIIANGALALSILHDLRKANARVQRAEQAMLALHQIDDLAQAGARNQRLYRVYKEPDRLSAYQAAEKELPARLQRLGRLIADDHDQFSQLIRLVQLVELDNTALGATVSLPEPEAPANREPPGFQEAVALSDEIVQAINGMAENEQMILDRHLAAIDLRARTVLATIVAGTLGSILLIAALFVLMRRDVRQSEALAQTQSGALQESERRFRRIYEESPLGIVVAQHDTPRIFQANPAFCRMLGYDAEHIVGRAIFDFVHIDDRHLLRDAIREPATPDQGVEIRCVTGSTVIAWMRVRLTQLSGPDERLLFLAEDITREKRVEAELRQAQKMEAIGQLTGGIAHDFNNLLGVIIGNAEFLMDAVKQDQEQVELAQEILNSALSGADLTRRLLAFASRQPLQPRQIDLNAYLPNHVAIVRRLLGETIQVTTKLAGDLWPTRADPSQVGDALLNLAINARDAMPYGGRISIETANSRTSCPQPSEIVAGDHVVLSVTDTGTGMAPEVLERVVEPFFTTKGPGAGSGLGLSMIFGFARQSGGHLHIESEPGQGTTVRLYLPRAQFADDDEAEAEPDLWLPKGKEAVLLVDDNPEMRTIARRQLDALGYRVEEAASGPAALAILQTGTRFDLLFTDIVMPDGMTGYQLAAAARQLQPGLKVLFTTGYVREDGSLQDDGPQTGDLIRKPYRKQELATTLRTTLEA